MGNWKASDAFAVGRGLGRSRQLGGSKASIRQPSTNVSQAAGQSGTQGRDFGHRYVLGSQRLEPWDCMRAPREGGLTEQRTQL